MSWKPIETAPKDGTFFIGANTDEAIVCNWPRQRNCDYVPGNWKKEGKEWYGSSIGTSSPLTHWRALPELPLLSVEVAEGNGHSADASKMVGPASAPAGEVAELVALIRQIALAWEPDACLLGNMTAGQLARAADLLEQRQAAPVPVAVGERWPEFSDCDPSNDCVWCFNPALSLWNLSLINRTIHTHWLPASALSLPTTVVHCQDQEIACGFNRTQPL